MPAGKSTGGRHAAAQGRTPLWVLLALAFLLGQASVLVVVHLFVL